MLFILADRLAQLPQLLLGLRKLLGTQQLLLAQGFVLFHALIEDSQFPSQKFLFLAEMLRIVQHLQSAFHLPELPQQLTMALKVLLHPHQLHRRSGQTTDLQAVAKVDASVPCLFPLALDNLQLFLQVFTLRTQFKTSPQMQPPKGYGYQPNQPPKGQLKGPAKQAGQYSNNDRCHGDQTRPFPCRVGVFGHLLLQGTSLGLQGNHLLANVFTFAEQGR